MKKLPVIVGMGGINAAGRSAGFHSYKRMVAESLSEQQMGSTWRDLATRMGLLKPQDEMTEDCIKEIINGTLIRRIDAYDPDSVAVNQKVQCQYSNGKSTFRIKKSKLPAKLPDHWQCQNSHGEEVEVTIEGELDLLLPTTSAMHVTSAGCVPRGFKPGDLYSSRNHPRGLQLTVFGASDLLASVGLDWEEINKHIKPDEVSVYAGSALAQVDAFSLGGLVGSCLKGSRTSSKMMPLSLAEMPADFINGYIINSVGSTGTNMGACASFLYNLRQGMMDIQSGVAKVVIVGNAEAPVEPEIMEGFRAMGALAEDHQLCKLDNTEVPNQRRACRPFSTNAGFTISESAQFFMLMDDELALKLGVNILGSVADIFVNADANKKSISSPGVGNYVTMAKAASLANSILGPNGLKHTYVQAHGTGTEQNRTTESHILNEIAKTYALDSWPVTAIKSYVGHSIGSAAGDQLCASLGVWEYGYIPGIKTIDHIADDVDQSNLNILMQDTYVGERGEDIKAVILNSKGFGGNNASGVILSPAQTMNMLAKKHGEEMINAYWEVNEAVKQSSIEADIASQNGNNKIIYKFGTAIMDKDNVTLSTDTVKLSEFVNDIDLPDASEFGDYL